MSALAKNIKFSSAQFSPCNQFRYTLYRRWGGEDDRSVAMFIGVNPSTATEHVDDPTVRRCQVFARDWGYSGMVMTNLLAYRATDPADMKRFAGNPVGDENDQWLKAIAASSALVVAAWGVHGTFMNRDAEVYQMLSSIKPLHVLRLTKDGHPAHPLYLPKNLKPIPWTKTNDPR